MNLPLIAYFFVRTKVIGKLLCISVFSALLYGIYLTDSRGTFLGAAALIAIYLLITKGGTKLILFGIAIGPVIATLIAARGGVSAADASASGRLDAWYHGIQMFLSNPVFGVGMGNFVEWHRRTAHNSFVMVSSELGFIGYCLWAGAIFLTVLAGYYIVKNKSRILENSNEVPGDKDSQTKIKSVKELEQELLLASALFLVWLAT